jgi:hypothetical protein
MRKRAREPARGVHEWLEWTLLQGCGEDFVYIVKKVSDCYSMLIRMRFNEEVLLSHLRPRNPYFP